MNTMYRQGDVLIRKIAALPDGTERVPRDNGRVILAYGEVTGHAHAILEPTVEKRELRLAAGIAEYLNAPQGATVLHEEHSPIPLEPGFYEIVHQREYSPQEIRRVRD